MNAFKDKSIEGIFSCIGRYESIRMLPGKSYDNQYYEEYKKVIYKVIIDELRLKDLQILYNINFGHTAPMITISYGALAEIDSDNNTFSILESGVM